MCLIERLYFFHFCINGIDDLQMVFNIYNYQLFTAARADASRNIADSRTHRTFFIFVL